MPFHAIRGVAHLLRVFSSFTVHLKNADVSFIYSWKNKAQLIIIIMQKLGLIGDRKDGKCLRLHSQKSCSRRAAILPLLWFKFCIAFKNKTKKFSLRPRGKLVNTLWIPLFSWTRCSDFHEFHGQALNSTIFCGHTTMISTIFWKNC